MWNSGDWDTLVPAMTQAVLFEAGENPPTGFGPKPHQGAKTGERLVRFV